MRWAYRYNRGFQNRHTLAIHEIRNKLKKAQKKGFQNITHRWDNDERFRQSQELEGRSRATMQQYDELAQQPAQVLRLSYQEREERYGTSVHLVLSGVGSHTHSVTEAPNYQQMLDQGPPEGPPPKSKGKGRQRRRYLNQSEQWQPYIWKYRRY